MKRLIVAAGLSTLLALGMSQTGFARAPSGHGGAGGGARGGGVGGGARMSRSGAPRTSSPGRIGRPPIGTAVPRPGGPRRPSYDGRSGWGYGEALGPGSYGYYNPLWYGAGAYGYPDAYDADPYAYGGYPYVPMPFATVAGQITGSLRLQIEPKTASVFVDRYYVGVVDDFDGHFQHLNLMPGPHHVDVREPGHDPVQFDVNIEPDHTVTYHGELQTE